MKRHPRLAPCSAIAAVVGSIAGCGTREPRKPPACPLARTAIPYSQCGGALDFTQINQYRGALADAQVREDAVVLVGGSCTGTLIAAAAGPVVLTAGHCVGLGDRPLLAFNVGVELGQLAVPVCAYTVRPLTVARITGNPASAARRRNSRR